MKALTILVVDDDIDNAQSLGELFEMEGHRVHVVHSGEAAIAAYVHGSFDVAFMDVMMPGKNGVESFLEIRKMKPLARVFMMTGYSVEELLQQALQGGALGVLEKPFDAEEVLRLTQSVGPGGLVLAETARRGIDVGGAIQSAISQAGGVCHLVRRPSEVAGLRQDDVLVIDADLPLIEEVSVLADSKRQGQRGPSILVSPHRERFSSDLPVLRDVGITGILNKPFDPLELLTRIHFLAA